MAYQARCHPMVKTAQQIATLTVRGVIRAEIWEILRQAGLATPPPPPRKKKRSHLHLIEDDGSHR